MNKLIKQAFTLIELLVVIAIIGILSGLIVVVMGGVTNKANIAKAQVFSNSLKNSLMLNLVSEWKLDQINTPNANQTPDSWSGGNTGTLTDASGACSFTGTLKCPQLVTSGCPNDNCLSFDGTDDYIDIGNKSIFDFGLGNFTVVAWIKVLNTQASGIIAKTNSIGANSGWYLSMSGSNSYAFRVGDGTTRIAAYYAVPDTNWHYVVGIREGDSVVIYRDGVKGTPSTGAAAVNINSSSYSLSFGQNLGYNYFTGSIDEVRIYNAAMPTSQIKEQYCIGLNKLLANGSISQAEYLKRINETAQK